MLILLSLNLICHFSLQLLSSSFFISFSNVAIYSRKVCMGLPVGFLSTFCPNSISSVSFFDCLSSLDPFLLNLSLPLCISNCGLVSLLCFIQCALHLAESFVYAYCNVSASYLTPYFLYFPFYVFIFPILSSLIFSFLFLYSLQN